MGESEDSSAGTRNALCRGRAGDPVQPSEGAAGGQQVQVPEPDRRARGGRAGAGCCHRGRCWGWTDMPEPQPAKTLGLGREDLRLIKLTGSTEVVFDSRCRLSWACFLSTERHRVALRRAMGRQSGGRPRAGGGWAQRGLERKSDQGSGPHPVT